MNLSRHLTPCPECGALAGQSHQRSCDHEMCSVCERLIGDRAYDSDPLDAALAARGVQMISPHRRGRRRPKTQDGRPLRRYKRRWKIERLFAWLQNFLGFVQLGCIIFLLRRL